MSDLKAPVLFLAFNRPKETSQTFEAIRRAKPEKLYLAADGPRVDRNDEEVLCEDVREILSNVDWDCDVKQLFRSENLGCQRAINEALDWFFENEEAGIIIEDDCLPHESFFSFCDHYLDKYENNNNISMICGSNFSDDNFDTDFTSRMFSIWGWASWRKVWQNYRSAIVKDVRSKELSFSEKIYYKLSFALVKSGKLDTWDVEFTVFLLNQMQSAIIARKNLIKNIGFSGHHSTDTDMVDINLNRDYDCWLPTIEDEIKENTDYDDLMIRTRYKPNLLLNSLRLLKLRYLW